MGNFSNLFGYIGPHEIQKGSVFGDQEALQLGTGEPVGVRIVIKD